MGIELNGAVVGIQGIVLDYKFHILKLFFSGNNLPRFFGVACPEFIREKLAIKIIPLCDFIVVLDFIKIVGSSCDPQYSKDRQKIKCHSQNPLVYKAYGYYVSIIIPHLRFPRAGTLYLKHLREAC
jgi:hypothetical protein